MYLHMTIFDKIRANSRKILQKLGFYVPGSKILISGNKRYPGLTYRFLTYLFCELNIKHQNPERHLIIFYYKL
jgi:hypothetical protein